MNASARASIIVTFAFTIIVAVENCTQVIPAIGMGGAGGASASGITTTGITVGPTGSTGAVTGPDQCAVSPTGHVISLTSSTGTAAVDCSFSARDDANHQYVANCTVEGCDCQVDGKSVCTCQDAAPTNCSMGCCPSPWKDGG